MTGTTGLSDAALLARLVGFDTTSRNSNLPLVDFLCEVLDRPGVRIVRQPSPDGAKANLIAWLGPEPEPGDPDRPGLVLSGHMDVVPAEEEGWRSDPFALADQGDRWVARGACDMKGFLALAVNAGLAAVSAGATGGLRAPLALVFTYDEEVGTLGARHLLEGYADGRLLPRSAVIGEPTSLRVVRAHKGHLKMRITLHGKSAHSGYPHLGVNAIEPAARVIEALAALRRTLEREHPPHRELFPEVPYVPLNVGTVHGGAAVNVIPDRCAVEVGVRPLPGMDSAALAERVRQAALAAVPSGLAPAFELLSDSPPMVLDESAPIHRHLCSLVGQQGGATVSFATDAGWLQRLGLDCAVFGPGTIEVAHQPNEHVPKAELARARELIDRTVARFCGEAE
jgi:acetylornithine deacetylase